MGGRLKEKVVLVSGAGSSGPGWGNGKTTAVLFAREGAKVLATDINLDAVLETKQIIEAEGGICEAVSGDVSRPDDVASITGACIEAFRLGRGVRSVGRRSAGAERYLRTLIVTGYHQLAAGRTGQLAKARSRAEAPLAGYSAGWREMPCGASGEYGWTSSIGNVHARRPASP
jgi:NAD(P)-dependent dehydrogenase (short-subunit alcohol dehydrogenase family)